MENICSLWDTGLIFLMDKEMFPEDSYNKVMGQEEKNKPITMGME